MRFPCRPVALCHREACDRSLILFCFAFYGHQLDSFFSLSSNPYECKFSSVLSLYNLLLFGFFFSFFFFALGFRSSKEEHFLRTEVSMQASSKKKKNISLEPNCKISFSEGARQETLTPLPSQFNQLEHFCSISPICACQMSFLLFSILRSFLCVSDLQLPSAYSCTSRISVSFVSVFIRVYFTTFCAWW